MIVLVTNSGGHVAPPLIAALLEAGAEVHVAHRAGSTSAAGLAGDGRVTLHEVDHHDPGSVELALSSSGADKVCLITPMCEDHQLILAAWATALGSAASSVKHVVRLSALNADQPTCLVERWHALNEVLIGETGIPATFVRPELFAENALVHASSIKAGGVFQHPCTKSIAFVAAQDVANVLALVCLSENDEYHGAQINLRGPKSLSNRDLCILFGKLTQKAVTWEPVTLEQYEESLLQAGFASDFVTAVVDLYENIEGDRGGSEADESIKDFLQRNPTGMGKVLKTHADQFM